MEQQEIAAPKPQRPAAAKAATDARSRPYGSRKSTAPLPSSRSRPALPTARSIRRTWSPDLMLQANRNRPPMNPSNLSQITVAQGDFDTNAHVGRDGRVHISVNALKDSALSTMLGSLQDSKVGAALKAKTEWKLQAKDDQKAPPELNIVIMVVGSRGDVQPFVAIAKLLKEKWGHRVRLATHGAFKEFVEENGIEFFEVGGDPAELMSFMVRNPGLIPNLDTIKAGDVGKRRMMMYEMFHGFWRSCIEPRDSSLGQGKQAGNKEHRHTAAAEDIEQADNASFASDSTVPEDDLVEDDDVPPFIADAIIANPPCFAHVHCAEKLGIPLHLMFTFPYSPTAEIAHPLAFIQNSNLGKEYTNAITYPMVEMMTWQGLGDLINRFRQKTLGLEAVSTLWAPGMIERLKVPYSYMWSPALIPKPEDWGAHIDVTGFVFLDQKSNYNPPDELVKFLDAGPPPIYIGFGSIVIDDPKEMTEKIFTAIKETGVRALVSKGWGGLGEGEAPEGVFQLDNCPHDWLFAKVSAVIHHGGAGTTAAGLQHGRPTMIVPFFGDQQFWGTMVANANAGAEPVPHKELTVEKLVDGIKKLLSEECQKAAQEISKKIREDDGDGAENAVRSFNEGLDSLRQGQRGLGEFGKIGGEGGPRGPAEGKWGAGGPRIRCSLLEEKVAVWRIKKTGIRLSPLAASGLVGMGKLKWNDVRLIRHTEWNDFDGPGEPLSGGISAFLNTVGGFAKGIVGVPYTWYKGAKRVEEEVEIDFGLPDELKPKHAIRDRLSLSKSKRQSESSSRGQPSTETTASTTATPQSDTGWTTSATSLSSEAIESTSEVNVPPAEARALPMKRKRRTSFFRVHMPHHSRTSHHHSVGHDVASGTRKSLAKAARAGARAPMDVSLAVAQGFHNAPRLYGDEVRHPYRITGFHSGMRAAGKEFAMGIYDGVTGLVTQPYNGAKIDGPRGFAKGVGKGFGGLLIKPQAGLAAVIGYPMKGVHKEIRKGRDRKSLRWVMRERRRQGFLELEKVRKDGGEDALNAILRAGFVQIDEARREAKLRNKEVKKAVTGVKLLLKKKEHVEEHHEKLKAVHAERKEGRKERREKEEMHEEETRAEERKWKASAATVEEEKDAEERAEAEMQAAGMYCPIEEKEDPIDEAVAMSPIMSGAGPLAEQPVPIRSETEEQAVDEGKPVMVKSAEKEERPLMEKVMSEGMPVVNGATVMPN